MPIRFNCCKTAVFILIITYQFISIEAFMRNKDDVVHYSNRWMAKIIGGEEQASNLTLKLNFHLTRRISDFPDVYELVHPRHPRRGKYENKILTEQLLQYEEILWAEQVSIMIRELKSISCPREESDSISNYMVTFNDVLWLDQWYMHSCSKLDDVMENNKPVYDLNVVPAYYTFHVSGYGVTVVIVDDGLETNHTDLANNYDTKFGLDLVDNDDDPNPIHTETHTFNHGTRCAGQIAMVADNHRCGVGVAPLVKLGAVRLVSGRSVDDIQESLALTFKLDDVDIFNNSWGPNDDGKVMPHMGPLTKSAIKRGIRTGRKGKGTLYVFSVGNGKLHDDNCACDTFISSMYTIAVAGADEYGRITSFSERCASVLVATYSGTGKTEYNVVTTDVNNECTRKHSGTSASAPLVTGVLALALELNDKLTWRDVQHLLVTTSEVVPFQNNPGWKKNNAGFYFSHDFGFGAVNAFNLLLKAENFITVPPMATCVVSVDLKSIEKSKVITRFKGLRVTFATSGCKNLPAEINYIEHVQLVVDIHYSKRGDLQIRLTSPHGTKSHLLMDRSGDTSTKSILNWPFDSVHFWGETPQGIWTVEIFDKTGRHKNHGELTDMIFVIHGTKNMPEHYTQSRQYLDFELPPEETA